METFYVKKTLDVRRNLKELEEKLKVKITLNKNQLAFGGEAIDEFVASKVFEAISFGFSVKKAMLLIDEEYQFRIVHIKDYTKRNLLDVKSRLIGSKGKTKRVFSKTSGCEILISESEVGIIGVAEDVQNVETAVVNLIRGSKQSNMYKYLEKQNKLKKENTSFADLK